MIAVKRTFFVYLLISFLLNSLFISDIYADDTVTIPVSASVADCLDFTWNMYKYLTLDNDPLIDGDPNQTVMNFYHLDEMDPWEYPGVVFTDICYCMCLWIIADEKYHIKQTSQSLMSIDGQHNIDNSFVVTPEYKSSDKWGDGVSQGPIGNDVLAAPSLVKNANILYYGNDAKSHILRLKYSIPIGSGVPGWQSIHTSQHPGVYNGTVTITITPQA